MTPPHRHPSIQPLLVLVAKVSRAWAGMNLLGWHTFSGRLTRGTKGMKASEREKEEEGGSADWQCVGLAVVVCQVR